ncbi:MAG: hypothetical protein EVJ46_05725 [Candidatus Acididesulfobacter guangdongensis]|uniref:Adenosylcobinamide kinase n=1 Tax=Acididesulfobacter guangdongensis TaxID=2597225 RepID=A0A519BGY4_ACIG2|nr:MAG: hypothetical protein EVJ46_05725 [Candidatus Acididesulfobacter guangdongensis]
MTEFKNIKNRNLNKDYNEGEIKNRIKIESRDIESRDEDKSRTENNANSNNNKLMTETHAAKPVKIFFTGGISSGKSKYAEKTALSILNNNLYLEKNADKSLDELLDESFYSNSNEKYIENSKRLHFIATANSLSSDNEMKIKIAEHKAKRPDCFTIHENFDDLKTEINNTYNSISVSSHNDYIIILIDSMTLWLSGIFTDLATYNEALLAIDDLFDFISKLDCFFIFVSDNLSFNIVPQDAYVRKFISLNGLMEQKISALCDFVYLTVAGNILRLK